MANAQRRISYYSVNLVHNKFKVPHRQVPTHFSLFIIKIAYELLELRAQYFTQGSFHEGIKVYTNIKVLRLTDTNDVRPHLVITSRKL